MPATPSQPRSEPTDEELQAARTAAVDAALAADEAEEGARKARRLAVAKMKHYESLLMIRQGQMTLPYEHL